MERPRNEDRAVGKDKPPAIMSDEYDPYLNLTRGIRHHRYWARQNSTFERTIQLLSIFSGVVGGVAGLVAGWPKVAGVGAALSAILPPLTNGVSENFDFAERSRWHWNYLTELLKVKHDLQTGKIVEADVRPLMIALLQRMIPSWPAKGKGQKPTLPQANSTAPVVAANPAPAASSG